MDAIRPNLFVGKLAETLDLELLHARGIGAMLQLAAESPQPGIISLYLPIQDGELLSAERLQRGVTFVREQQAAGHNVLIACGLGVSRASTFATAVLKEAEALSLLDSFAAVVAARREARPHPILWQSLCECYGETIEFTEMMKLCRPQRLPW